MAIRIENNGIINFGTLAAETVITHARISVGNNVLMVRPLTTSRTVAVGGQAQFSIGEIDIVFPSNELQNAGFHALLSLALDGTNTMLIDAMTDDSTVVVTTGYSQQATKGSIISRQAASPPTALGWRSR